jgi:hypothetical protein
MKRVLNILTREDDMLARDVTSSQGTLPNCDIEVVDLTAGAPDYAELLQKIFGADSIVVW